MYPIVLTDSCAILVQKFNPGLEVKSNMNEHLLMCQLQLIPWWSSDILLEASL